METFEDTRSLPQVLATAVGSLPHADAEAAVSLICGALAGAPHIPQLSKADLREQMWLQCTEGLPRFRVDFEQQRYFFDTSGDSLEEVERFYEQYLQIMDGAPPDAFAIGPVYGKSIHAFRERLQAEGRKRPFVKVQVTGPLSFGMTVTDETGKPIFYHPVFRDIACKGMGLKAMWLIEAFKPFAEQVIVFFDEPSLSAYGSSAFMGVSKNDVVESLDDVIAMAVAREGIPGIHCCGNTDWGLVMETTARILNFDAVDYLNSMAIYGGELASFVARGGVLAWGAVPNTERIEQESVDDIVNRIRNGIDVLAGAGADRQELLRHLILTPACGCAGLTEQQAEQVYRLLAEAEPRLAEEMPHWG
jgi:methionine synthase II (cobalamin-independent)